MLKFNKWNIHVSSFIPDKIKLCNRKCVILIWSEKKSQTRLKFMTVCNMRMTSHTFVSFKLSTKYNHIFHFNFKYVCASLNKLLSKKQRPWKAQCIEWLYLLTNPCNFLSEIYWREFLFTLRSNLVLKNKFGMKYP